MAQYRSGHVPDAWIEDVLDRLLLALGPETVGVLRTLDSSSALEDLQSACTYLGLKHTTSSGNVCLDARELNRLVRGGFLSGFDELWLFRDSPPAVALTNLQPLTSDAIQMSEGAAQELMSAFESVGALAALGDGCGLNWIVRDPQLATLIESAAIP